MVVFDGEIGVVEHLRDQAVVEVVALDWVVFVHRADGLDHLLFVGNRDMRRRPEEGSEPLEEAACSLLCFCHRRLPQSNTGWITPDEIYALFIPGFSDYYQ